MVVVESKKEMSQVEKTVQQESDLCNGECDNNLASRNDRAPWKYRSWRQEIWETFGLYRRPSHVFG